MALGNSLEVLNLRLELLIKSAKSLVFEKENIEKTKLVFSMKIEN